MQTIYRSYAELQSRIRGRRQVVVLIPIFILSIRVTVEVCLSVWVAVSGQA